MNIPSSYVTGPNAGLCAAVGCARAAGQLAASGGVTWQWPWMASRVFVVSAQRLRDTGQQSYIKCILQPMRISGMLHEDCTLALVK